MKIQIDSTILICSAVMMEAKAIARRLKLKNSGPFCWKSEDVALLNTGIGAKRLGEVEKFSSPKIMIMAGLAGGLDPALKVADVVVQADSEIAKLLGGKIGAHLISHNCLATVADLVASPQDKMRLRKETRCAAVDMETAIAERFARSCKMHFMAIRAISDTADQTLSPKVAALVDSDGRPRPAKVAAALLRNPGLMKELSRLKRSADAACGTMADTVAEAVSKWRELLATK